MSEELKPCPFCSKKPDTNGRWEVSCSNDSCPLYVSVFFPHEWNTRAVTIPQEVVDILDQIRKSGFVSYDGEKPHVLAVKALALINAGEDAG